MQPDPRSGLGSRMAHSPRTTVWWSFSFSYITNYLFWPLSYLYNFSFSKDKKTYLSKTELLYLYQEALYQKVHLILLEAALTEQIEYEKIVIIDADKCVINI